MAGERVVRVAADALAFASKRRPSGRSTVAAVGELCAHEVPSKRRGSIVVAIGDLSLGLGKSSLECLLTLLIGDRRCGAVQWP